jgi:hypothetical protein
MMLMNPGLYGSEVAALLDAGSSAPWELVGHTEQLQDADPAESGGLWEGAKSLFDYFDRIGLCPTRNGTPDISRISDSSCPREPPSPRSRNPSRTNICKFNKLPHCDTVSRLIRPISKCLPYVAGVR